MKFAALFWRYVFLLRDDISSTGLKISDCNAYNDSILYKINVSKLYVN